MRTFIGLVITLSALIVGGAVAQEVRFGEHGLELKFGHEDPRRDVEGKRASCDTYARIAVI